MSFAAHADEVHVGPNLGPQTAYVASAADITIFGGTAGPGKSWGTLFRMGVHADRYPGYYGVVFRRESPQITGGGGLWEESTKLYPIWGAKARAGGVLDWRWPNRSMVEFRHLQNAGDELAHHGKQYAEVAFDELTTFLEQQFWYLISRLRSTCGFRPRMVATTNPDSESWVRRLIDWWIGADGLARSDRAGAKRYFIRDGDELVWGDTAAEASAAAPHVRMRPMSLRFIPATLADNPRGDPTYEERLKSLPLVERERLLGGNWNVKHAAGTVFRREWFEVIDYVPHDIVAIGRYWDLAATEPNPSNKDPDWTRGVKISKHASGLFVVHNVASTRKRTHDVDALVLTTAQQDGRGCRIGFWQDPGQAGKSQAERYRKMLAGYDVTIAPAALSKVVYAKPTSSQAEGGNVKLIRGEWNDAYLAEHEAFPDGRHDDIVDGESLGVLDMTSSTPSRFIHVKGI
jgi:predicted phage terminase large subunit-like protein